MPDQITRLIATFRDLNPDLNHLLFDREGAEAFLAEHHSERELAAFRSCAVPAMQSDYFRYCAILTLGGIYVDADFLCRRPLSPLFDSVKMGLLFTRPRRGYVLNGIFLFHGPGHPLLLLARNIASANVEQRVHEKVNLVTGPWIFTGLAAMQQAASFQSARRLLPPRLAGPMLDAVRDKRRLDSAFEGVRIAPMDMAWHWIGQPGEQLSHKRGPRHWVNWHTRGDSIYR